VKNENIKNIGIVNAGPAEFVIHQRIASGMNQGGLRYPQGEK
jgi:hypothetical protein